MCILITHHAACSGHRIPGAFICVLFVIHCCLVTRGRVQTPRVVMHRHKFPGISQCFLSSAAQPITAPFPLQLADDTVLSACCPGSDPHAAGQITLPVAVRSDAQKWFVRSLLKPFSRKDCVSRTLPVGAGCGVPGFKIHLTRQLLQRLVVYPDAPGSGWALSICIRISGLCPIILDQYHKITSMP